MTKKKIQSRAKGLAFQLGKAYIQAYQVMPPVKSRSYPTLAAWRDATGLSQAEAARVLGISQTAYSRLERQVTAARGKRARAIWRQTGVPVEVLVGAV